MNTSSTKSLRWHLRRSQIDFNALVREKGTCERCGADQGLHCSHCYTVKAYPNLRFNVFNVCCLCWECHAWWHAEQKLAWSWFKSKHPDRYEILQQIKNIYHKYNIPELLQLQEYIKNKDLQKLIIPLDITTLS